MKKSKISDRTNINDISSIKNLLEELLKLKDDIVIQLLEVLKQTNDPSVRKNVSLFLVDNFTDKRIMPALIKLIRNPELQMHNADLVYACSEYSDTKSHINFFIDLVIKGDFQVSWNAYETIIRMSGDFGPKECAKFQKILKNAFSENDAEKNDILNALVQYFDRNK